MNRKQKRYLKQQEEFAKKSKKKKGGKTATLGVLAAAAATALILKTRKDNLQKDEYELWDDSASFYDLKFLSNKKLYGKIIESIKEELNPNMKVLEIATSTGIVARKIADDCASIIASDFSEKMINQAKQHGTPANLIWDVQDAASLTYPDESFDAVIIVNALDSFTDVESVLLQVKRVLNKDGILIAPNVIETENVVAKTCSAAKEYLGYAKTNFWNYEEYQEMIRDNGWDILRDELIDGSMPVEFLVAAKSDN